MRPPGFAKISRKNKDEKQDKLPPSTKACSFLQEVSFTHELQAFCNKHLGKDKNWIFLMMNVLVWAALWTLVRVSNTYFMSEGGVLATPMDLYAEKRLELSEGETPELL